MKPVFKLTLLGLMLFSLILAGMLVMMVDDRPVLDTRAHLTPERIAHGKRVFDQYDPRRLRSGAIAQVSLAQEDLELACNYFANQHLGGVAGLRIDSGRARVQFTWKLPSNPLGGFLNMKLELLQNEKLPVIDRLTLGRLWIPGPLVTWLMQASAKVLQPSFDWHTFAETFRSVRFEPGRMIVIYQWREDLPGKLSGVIWTPQDQERIEVYQRGLADLTQGGRNSLNLTALIRPLFRLAMERSSQGEAVAENRALILVLAFYANQRDLRKLVAAPWTWPRPNWRRVKLSGREDLAKHYLVSAMLAAYAGTPLADAVGLYKEIQDARGGSGFSFSDIAADRAGTRMGELAIDGEAAAKKIQALMARAAESDFMPVTADLPEFMPEAELERRFGGTHGEHYQKMMENIERRIAALPVNRD